MLDTKLFVDALETEEFEFFTGVPDSLLKPLLAYVQDTYDERQHIICANEGNALALAVGYHLGTKKIPVVYMQNSGLGNIVNPLTSLTDPEIYSIPTLLLIGWRGEPEVKDEPQHIKQGKITPALLELLGVDYEILSLDLEIAKTQIKKIKDNIRQTSKPCALLIQKDTFSNYKPAYIKPELSKLSREQAIQIVLEHVSKDKNNLVLSTTGKISRELYESRIKRSEACCDFLNVGSMGHISSISLGVALAQPNKKIYCLDGDGAMLMHMGSMAIIGGTSPANLIHIVLNNAAHESVGGQPTAAATLDIPSIGSACAYQHSLVCDNEYQLQESLESISDLTGPILIEIKVAIGARSDLGRPQSTPEENKMAFMEKLHA